MKISQISEKARSALKRLRSSGTRKKSKGKAPAVTTGEDDLRTDEIPKRKQPLESQYVDEGVVMLGTKKYAVNLNWRPYRDDQSLGFQAEQARGSVNLFLTYELYADLKKKDQVGFAASEISHRNNMQVLATAVPSLLTGPRWIGAFRIGTSGEYWWLVSVRDGAIYEDSLVNGTEEAVARLNDELEAPGWTRIFAPVEWGIEGATHAAIEDLVDPAHALRLRPVKPFKTYAPRILLSVLIISGAVAAYFIYDQIQKNAAAELARLSRMQGRTVVVYMSDFPWHERTAVIDFTDTCRDEIEKSTFLVQGWEAQPISCTVKAGKGVVTASWTQTDSGRISWLRAAMPADYPQPTLAQNGKLATLVRSFDTPFIEGVRDVEHWSPNLISSTLQERFQTLGLDLRIALRKQRTPERAEMTKPVFNYHEIGFSTDYSMEEHSRLFADIPVLVPEALILNVASGTWTFTGKAYHEPIMPLNTELR